MKKFIVWVLIEIKMHVSYHNNQQNWKIVHCENMSTFSQTDEGGKKTPVRSTGGFFIILRKPYFNFEFAWENDGFLEPVISKHPV